jgi:hypothetical protein
MVDQLISVDSDRGPLEPTPVTIMQNGQMVDMSALAGGSAATASPNMATGQVAVATTATLVVAARPTRRKVTITATSAVTFYVGNSGVTTTTGALAGTSVTLEYTGAIYAVGASALTVTFTDLYV